MPRRQLSEGIDDVTAQTRVYVFGRELGGARAILGPVGEVAYSFDVCTYNITSYGYTHMFRNAGVTCWKETTSLRDRYR